MNGLGWKTLLKWDDLGVPLFSETSKYWVSDTKNQMEWEELSSSKATKVIYYALVD